MSTNEPGGIPPAPIAQCSNPTCRATFVAPVQQCLTCGALLSSKLLNERFRIDVLLGRGGMGAVYGATDLTLGRQVALKVLAPSAGLAGDAPDQLRARFFREARLAAQLDHPNIVSILHFDIDGPLAYLVMPLLTGGTLARRIRPKQPTDPAAIAGWLRQIAAALDYAHTRPQPIVHRDVKPGNLLFHEDGRLCLADFGIARVVAGTESSETAHLTRSGVILGSLAYMAPEQINGRAVPASDQYSVGILLYELLTGVLPFEASDSYGLIIQHASVSPVPPSERVPGLPPGLDGVVLRALAKEPAERFPTVSALAEAFSNALSKAATSQFQGAPQPRATAPVAPRLTLALPDDSLSDLPTEAATKRRALPTPAAVGGTFSGGAFPMAAPPGAPPQIPPQPPRHRRRNWLIVAFSGLLALCLCVGVLAALSKQGQSAKSNAAATGTAAAPSATPNPYLMLLMAAEKHKPSFSDRLINNAQGWTLKGAARFASDGLHLASPASRKGSGNDTKNSSAIRDKILLSNCDIEVDLRYSGPQVAYGFGFLPLVPAKHVILLDSTGNYVVALLQGIDLQPINPKSGMNAGLVLLPDTTYHLAVLIQGEMVSFFLGQPGQVPQYILTLTYSSRFEGSGILGLANFNDNDQPATDLIYKNLTIYPLA